VVYVPDCGGAVPGNSAYSAVQPGLYGVRRWHRFVEDIDFNYGDGYGYSDGGGNGDGNGCSGGNGDGNGNGYSYG
jgi:hypothetical protein